MTATIIDGKASAARLREKIAAETSRITAAHGIQPGLATVLVGNDPASEVYVRNKGKTAEKLGFKSVHVAMDADTTQEALLAQVRALNADKSIHGILVQLPLPKHLDETSVLDALDPAKDVDALTPTNAGLLMSGRAHLVSCTPAGVMLLLKEYVGDIAGKDVLVIGRSLLFGKPAAQLLLAANATVTMAHSRSRDLPALARRADILVAAIGKPELPYVEFPDDAFAGALVSAGFAPELAASFVEMSHAMNTGLLAPSTTVTSKVNGATTIEAFARQFAEAFSSPSSNHW